MAEYTIEELIDVLNKFPKDLKISNDLALTWEFDKKAIGKAPSYNDKEKYAEFMNRTMEHATSLFILEGDWEKATVESFERLWK